MLLRCLEEEMLCWLLWADFASEHLDGRDVPADLEIERLGADVSRVDGHGGGVVPDCQLQCDCQVNALRKDARERLGGVLERGPHRGVVVSHEREDLAVLDRQVQRASRQGDVASRQDNDPLEPQSQSGDGEGVGFLLDDLENASGSNLTVETSKVLIFRLRRLKLAKTHSILLYGRM